MNTNTLNSLSVVVQKNYFLGLTGKPIEVKAYHFSTKGVAIISPKKFKLGQAMILKIACGCHTLRCIPGRIVNTTAATTEYHYGVAFTLTQLPKSMTKGVRDILQKLETDTHLQQVMP